MFHCNSILRALRINSLNFYTCTVKLRSFSLSRQQAGIIEEKLNFVTTIGINRPELKNEIDEDTYNELVERLISFEKDENACAAVLYGVGGNFCTGCSPQVQLDSFKLISSCKKPIVASLTGYATGFGFELALLCDLRVMESTAQVGLNAYPVKMSDHFYKRLVSIVGVSWAMDLSLTGRNVAAKEAFQYGLANRIVDCGTGIGQGITLAKWIGKYPSHQLSVVKNAVLESLK